MKVQLVTEDKDRIYLNSQQFVMRMDTPKSGSNFVAKHKREKAKKCNTCGFVSLFAGSLRRHIKTHTGKKRTHASNVTMHLLMQAI